MSSAQHILFAYIIGSIPSGLIIGKLFGVKDVRNMGSGNIGASNVTRSIGKTAGLLTLLSDFAKAPLLFYIAGANHICFLALFLGSIFSPFLGFSGGKGMGLTMGILSSIDPKLLLISVLIWASLFAITRIPAIGSISVSILLIFNSYLKGEYLYLILGVLIIIRHYKNIKNLLSKYSSS